MKAAVLHNTGDTTLDVRDDIEVVDPGPDEVKVRIVATGVCHSDLSAMDGTLPQPAPCVPGHEGAGEVVEVGSNVSSLTVGDKVIISWIPPCGKCSYCLGGQPNLCMVLAIDGFTTPRFRMGETQVFGFAGTGTFAEYMVVREEAAVKVADDVPYDVAALIGCGVMTGVGAAINTANVQPGSSVVVIGCGGVGISVIQGARIAGAAEIVAVDPVEKKHAWAKQFGATHAVTPEQLVEVTQELTGGEGYDYAFEVVGRPQTIRATYDAARRGGTAVILGVGRSDETIELNAFELFYMEKKLLGSIYGSSDIRIDYDRMIRLWRYGRLDLAGMITGRRKIEDINEAFDLMKSGESIRTIIDL